MDFLFNAIDMLARRCSVNGEWLHESDVIGLDGHSGRVFAGAPKLTYERPTACLAEVSKWRALEAAPAPHAAPEKV
jgi:hypothetical protein